MSCISDTERSELPCFGVDGEGSLGSTESSFTIELMGSKYLKKAPGDMPFNNAMNWKSKVNLGQNYVSRGGQDAALDRFLSTGAIRGASGNRSAGTLTASGTRSGERTADVDRMKEIRAELVVMRTRQENCRDFIAYCGNCTTTGPWSKRTRRFCSCYTMHRNPF